MNKSKDFLELEEVYLGLEAAVIDLYDFLVCASSGRVTEAETILLDSLFLGLQKGWFVKNEKGKLSHEENREDFFAMFWQAFRKQTTVFKKPDGEEAEG